jgi:hypothetical protein
MNLGEFGVVTPEAARSRALQALAQVAAGVDPLDEKQALRNAIAVAELSTIFELRHIDLNPRVKASTGREYRHSLKRYILPALGKLKVASVTRADVARLHSSMAGKPYQANRTLEVVSKMFNLAEDWDTGQRGRTRARHLQVPGAKARAIPKRGRAAPGG